ncbi:hypothetical protein CBS101457_005254 [Exobasidium rhododendri]|nr:hypothetical protein CBS101457_005254 [Exobasidium rhododendri]
MSALGRFARMPAARRHTVGLLQTLRASPTTTVGNFGPASRHFSQVSASTAPLRRPTMKLTLEQRIQLSRNMHVRALSFSTIPRIMLRSIRFPAYVFTAAGGAFAYANYKVDEFRNFMGDFMSRASDRASDMFSSVSHLHNDALSSAQQRWQLLSERLDNIQAPKFMQDIFNSEGKSPAGGKEESRGEEQSGGDGGAGGNGGAPVTVLAASILGSSKKEEEKEDVQASLDPTNTSEELMLLTRKLIEVRNILKSVDHESDSLTLPSIVVIGSQSSGKSSVLEAIVGHEFLPKGNNMVTRRPIELTLIHTQPSSKGPVEYAEFPGLGLGKVTDFKQVQKTLFDRNMAVSEEECVSEVPIELRIYSPHVPDLTMIDLPGYVQLASMDQPEQLREKISALCEKYIAEPNIILAVCAADVDLANSPALRASRKVDPLGLRTIGVITKMDLVEPSAGAAILSNNKYPLALGYIGVICKSKLSVFKSAAGHDGISGQGNLTAKTLHDEDDYFRKNQEHFGAPTRGRNKGVEPMIGTNVLRKRLMSVLEESMGSSLHGIANAVQLELEEASYQFKVQYNDRNITAESYVAETMDALKLRFKEFAERFGKPEVRQLLKQSLDDKVMDILADVYWEDPRRDELIKLAEDRKTEAEDLDRHWQYKLDASSSALTKSGIGRTSTQLVVDALRYQVDQLAQSEPFNHHPDAKDRILSFCTDILRERFALTSDQVENCVKPFKYEVEVEKGEWEEGRVRSVGLLERELKMCSEAEEKIRKAIGGRKLRSAIDYVNQVEERKRRIMAARAATASGEDGGGAAANIEDPLQPEYSNALLGKAKEAMWLNERSHVLKMRMATLKSRRCKAGPQSKIFCPEAFLNVVADKLTYTAVMFINIELLAEFFYQFPREIDSHLVYDLDKSEIIRFARENPKVKAHLDLQEKKEKLDLVMEKLDSLVKVYQEKQAPKRESKWSLF